MHRRDSRKKNYFWSYCGVSLHGCISLMHLEWCCTLVGPFGSIPAWSTVQRLARTAARAVLKSPHAAIIHVHLINS